MTRVLTVLLSLAIATAAAATPVVACTPDSKTVGTQRHGCCDEPQVTTAPAGTCCIITAPARDRATTESRVIVAATHRAAVVVSHAAWLQWPDPRTRGPASSPPPSGGAATVPIYLQQLSLLI